jgi:hypothetical protein
MLQCFNPGAVESVAGSLPNSGMVDCFWIVMVMVTVAFLSSWIKGQNGKNNQKNRRERALGNQSRFQIKS